MKLQAPTSKERKLTLLKLHFRNQQHATGRCATATFANARFANVKVDNDTFAKCTCTKAICTNANASKVQCAGAIYVLWLNLLKLN